MTNMDTWPVRVEAQLGKNVKQFVKIDKRLKKNKRYLKWWNPFAADLRLANDGLIRARQQLQKNHDELIAVLAPRAEQENHG